jgi:hypothetical protein
MQDYLDIFMRSWSDFSTWHPPMPVMMSIIVLGLMSSYMMTRFIAASALFVGPISFMILSFAAMACNFYGRGIALMGSSDMQKALMFTVIGHSIAAVALMFAFKVSASSASR